MASYYPALRRTSLPHFPRLLRYSTIIFGIVALAISLVYFGIVRPWHMRWGATDTEMTQPLPGDPYLPVNAVVSTRAITINAPADKIWPWIAQIGQAHAGWYSYDWIENLLAAKMQNRDVIIPEFQNPKVRDRVSFQQDGPTTEVSLVDPGRALVLEGWTLYLEPIDAQTTRLIVRYPWPLKDSLVDKFFYYAVAEPWHFVMESGMMQGIKQSAEMSAGSN